MLGGMHLARLRLRNFRNYARLDAVFTPGFHLIVGDNAQGKTNLLEAIYLLATLRSFRGVGSAPIVRHGQSGYFVAGHVVGQGEHQIKMYWSATVRHLTRDSQPVRRLTDYLGTLRVVVCCTEDLQLVKGPARTRRRFLDLLLTQTQADYLPLLQRYLRALRARNALLRQRPVDEAALDSFTRELVAAGTEITRRRQEVGPRFLPLLRNAYRHLAGAAEVLSAISQPSVKGDYAVALAQSRVRERACGMTLIGPHRDDLLFLLNDRALAQFGSEGQKRGLAIALKLAQAEFLTAVHGSAPVLLLDDVMGELDANRRRGLLPLLDHARHAGGQVFLTATAENWLAEWGRDAQRWRISAGTLTRLGSPS